MKESDFWAGEFGDEYISRNDSEKLYQSNVEFFCKALRDVPFLDSIIELGANVGLNLAALKHIYGNELKSVDGVEINEKAFSRLLKVADVAYNCNLFDSRVTGQYDLAFTKGVLIHIHPDDLQAAYKRLFDLSRRYILICEYYNPKPVEIEYRGEKGKLWKRDFAGEMMDAYPLRLVDYGFVYHRDKWPQDDLNWFLMEKINV
jgi:pseudaminic acid biosynthesis-associated methylase